MSNLDSIWQAQKERLAWLRTMFSTKQSWILFGVWTLAVFVLSRCSA